MASTNWPLGKTHLKRYQSEHKVSIYGLVFFKQQWKKIYTPKIPIIATFFGNSYLFPSIHFGYPAVSFWGVYQCSSECRTWVRLGKIRSNQHHKIPAKKRLWQPMRGIVANLLEVENLMANFIWIFRKALVGKISYKISRILCTCSGVWHPVPVFGLLVTPHFCSMSTSPNGNQFGTTVLMSHSSNFENWTKIAV